MQDKAAGGDKSKHTIELLLSTCDGSGMGAARYATRKSNGLLIDLDGNKAITRAKPKGRTEKDA